MTEKHFNPLSTEFEDALSAIEPNITPQQLLEIVTEEIEKQLPVNLIGESPSKIAARQKVFAFMLDMEYKEGDLEKHIANTLQKKMLGRWPADNQDPSIVRVEELCKKYNGLEDKEDESFVEDINRVVGPGGLTRIHIAAMDGEFEEVKELYEKGARIDILDNQGWNAATRARVTGHIALSEWLSKQKPHVSER